MIRLFLQPRVTRMRMRILLLILFLLSGWTMTSNAWATDYIDSRAVLEDRSGELTIGQAVAAEFQPVGDILSRGYTDSAHWLRITVKPRADGGELALRIRPTFLDEVTLYEPDLATGAGWKKSVTGDRTPFMMREHASVTLGFTIKPSAPESTYYLRIKTSSSSILNVEAIDPRTAGLKDAWLGLFQTIFLAFILFVLFWAINDYISSRQAIVAWFILHQCGYLFYTFAITGNLALLIPSSPAGLGDTLTSISVCMTTLFGLVFHRFLLALFLPSRLALRLLDALILTMLVALVILAAGQPRLALQANALIILLGAPLLTVIAFTARQNRRVLRIIYCLLAAPLLFSMMALLGWINTVEWTLNAWMSHGFTSTGLMFLLLNMRSRQLQREGAQASLQHELTRIELASERQQREAQNLYMAMLSHELKTPLSVIRMVLGMQVPTATVLQHAQQSVADMDVVVERCLQVDQLEYQRLNLMQQACHVDDLLANLRDASAAPQRFIIRTEALPTIKTDPQLLHVALSNLIDNALKYADAKKLIHIEAFQSEHQARRGILVSIANAPNSAGMPDPQRVFEKYYRSTGAHSKTGSGLGLYLVRGLIEQLGGWVRYTPSLNEVRFELWIPC